MAFSPCRSAALSFRCLLAASIWTTGLFYLSYLFGALTEQWLGWWRWPAILLAFLLPLYAVQKLVRAKTPKPAARPSGRLAPLDAACMAFIQHLDFVQRRPQHRDKIGQMRFAEG